MKCIAYKRIISAILIFCLLCSFALCASADTAAALTFTANGKNTSRAADTIIVYTQDGTTGTNRYGYEVVVDENGKIISKGGNNCTVPEDGFVLSGHGTGAQFLKEKAVIGQYATFCPITLEVTFDNTLHLPFGSKTVTLNGINLYRSSNFIVVYTPSYKYKTTGTNRWGNEATVENGIVTSIGGNNSKIPENGFVISAVENALNWFSDAISVGVSAAVSESDKTLTVSYDMNSVIYADKTKLKELDKKILSTENNSEAFSAYLNAEAQLNLAIKQYNTDKDAFKYLDFSKKFAHTVDSAASLFYTSCDKELRGVWYSPRETTREQVERIVEQMYSLGLNYISLLGFSDGVFLTSVPKDSPFTSALTLGKEDIIKYYAEACHKRNMKFSLWIPIFNVGYSSSTYVVTKKLPELQVLSQNNKPETINGYVYLDPSNKDATNLLLNTYEHILKNYDIDTFELDYIRYAGTSGSLDFGYHTNAQKEFEKKYGETPIYDRSWHLWNEWCLFRASYITDFVHSVHDLIKRVKPDTFLSADVFCSNDTQYSIYQDWQTWTKNEYIDILIPMLYGVNTFYDNVDIFAEDVKKSNYLLVTGLSVSGDAIPPEILAEQIKTSREKGASGVSLFSLPSSFKCNNPRIKDGLFKTPADFPICFYTVCFTDGNSNVISTQTVKGGTSAYAPNAPENSNPHAVFEHWSTDFSAVSSDLTVSPVYSYTQCIDADGDNACDICQKDINSLEKPAEKCNCICHKTGFTEIIYKLLRFFWKMFGIKQYCDCKEAHY